MLSRSGKPSPGKRIVYLCASTALGVLLSFLAHVAIELWYLRWVDAHDTVIRWQNGCALPILVQILLPLIGALGGFALGRWWWRMVYVDGRW